MSERATLSIWTVYDHPADWPDWFIARRWEIGGGQAVPTESMILHRRLDELRSELEDQGLYCLPRNESDDPTIMETWI